MSQPGSSLHVRFGDQEAVVQALRRVGYRLGESVRVWPPRRLARGLLVSPVRNGWVSVWSTLPELHDLVQPLTATLECGAVALVVIPDDCWSMDIYRHGAWLGGWVRPRVSQLDLDDDDYDEIVELADEPPLSILAPLLPPEAELESVAARMFAADDGADDPSPDEVLECLGAELCLMDFDWDPADDAEQLGDGEYADEDMPIGWQQFVLLPTPQLPLLDADWEDREEA